MRKRSEDLKKLAKIRERNESISQLYKAPQSTDIYEEVEEKEYENVVKRRLKEQSFVVDDDGCGYADDGHEIWDDAPSEATLPPLDAKNKKKRANLHSESNKSITDLFNRAASSSKKGFCSSREASSANAKEFLDSLHEQDCENSGFPCIPRSRPSERMKIAQEEPIEEENAAKKPIEIDSIFSRKKTSMEVNEQERSELKTCNQESAQFNNAIQCNNLHSVQPPSSSSSNLHSVQSHTPKAIQSNNILHSPSSSNNPPIEDSFDEEYFSPDDIAQVDSILMSSSPVKQQQQQQPIPQPQKLVFDAIPTLEMHQESPSSNLLSNSSIANCLKGTCVNFYWIDLQEKPNSNTVYLLGKLLVTSTNSTGSEEQSLRNCCVTVTQITKIIFFLPNPEANPADLMQEIDHLMAKAKISTFTKRIVTRKYAFELANIPFEAEYVKVTFPWNSTCNFPLCGAFYSHVFGCGIALAETLLIKRKIMGPCWLSLNADGFCVKAEGGSGVSWCPIELEVAFKSLSPCTSATSAFPEPLFDVAALDFKTVINQKTASHEIVAASLLIFKDVNINQCAAQSDGGNLPSSLLPSSSLKFVRHIEGLPFPPRFQERFPSGSLQVVKGERILINKIASAFNIFNPDIVIGHNILNFDLDVLLARIRATQAEEWPKLGRLKFTMLPKSSGSSSEWAIKQLFCGRLICDTYHASRDLVRAKVYSLESLAASELSTKRPHLEEERIVEYFQNADSLSWLLKHCENDSLLAARLAFKIGVLPLTRQLTILAGNIWWRTFAGARAERNEFLLLHEFHRAKYIVPDKQATTNHRGKMHFQELDSTEEQTTTSSNAVSGKKKKSAAYAGGLVLEPKKGLYDKYILLLDYNSLYPSIIQEFNICFTTVQRTASQDDDGNSPEVEEAQLPVLPDKNVSQGILPRLLANLVARRKQVKALMKESSTTKAQLADLEIRQKALKLTANSMYGCLGFQHSRFYAKELAMLVTGKGREILQSTVQIAQEQCSLQVIYGDTDSVMINTNTCQLEEALKMGQELKKAVNEKYRLLEIEIDGIFSRLLLLKKKKYAALQQLPDGSCKLEMKGLDLVRRDWCDLSVDISTFILNQIMQPDAESDQVVQRIHEHLSLQAQAIRTDQIPLAKFVINKSLTKATHEYSDPNIHPHVQVAISMQNRGVPVKVGDVIPYVIVANHQSSETTTSNYSGLGKFARHPDDLSKDSSLQIDYEWYLTQQIHPPIARLCEYIEGTDSRTLGSFLGLKISSCGSGSSNSLSERDWGESCEFKSFFSFDGASVNETLVQVNLEVGCPNCKSANSITCQWLKEAQSQCGNCGEAVGEVALWLSILGYWRSLQAKYYRGQVICEDEQICRHRSGIFDLSLSGMQCPDCEGGSSGLKVQFRDRDLFFALKAVWWMFSQAENDSLYGNLLVGISMLLDEISFRTVDLEKLFSSMAIISKH